MKEITEEFQRYVERQKERAIVSYKAMCRMCQNLSPILYSEVCDKCFTEWARRSFRASADMGGDTVTKPLFQIGRKISQQRIAAYECVVDASAVTKGKWVTGWYGMFDEERLKEDLLPKLAEYVEKSSASYPMLIVSYTLETKTDVWIEGSPKRARAKDVKFRPRRRRSSYQRKAIVYSRTGYQLLDDLG